MHWGVIAGREHHNPFITGLAPDRRICQAIAVIIAGARHVAIPAQCLRQNNRHGIIGCGGQNNPSAGLFLLNRRIG